MSYFDDVYDRLFRKSNSNQAEFLVDEIICRSKTFDQKFQDWKNSDECKEFIGELEESYFWSKQGIDKNPQIHLLASDYSNGFAVDYEPRLAKDDFQFLFDLLADKMKKIDYRLVLSRHTVKEKGDVIETKEMHYLKPKRGFIEPIDQKYGNVQIEYFEENNKPTRIKLVANSYPDRKYKEADKFEDLAQYIFSLNT